MKTAMSEDVGGPQLAFQTRVSDQMTLGWSGVTGLMSQKDMFNGMWVTQIQLNIVGSRYIWLDILKLN